MNFMRHAKISKQDKEGLKFFKILFKTAFDPNPPKLPKEGDNFYHRALVHFFYYISQDFHNMQKFLSGNLNIEKRKNLTFLLEDPRCILEEMIQKPHSKKSIGFLFDQSTEIEPLLEDLNEGRNIQAAFSYPSSFGKTTLLQLIESYFNGQQIESFRNWKVMKNRNGLAINLKAKLYDTVLMAFHSVVIDLLQITSPNRIEELEHLKGIKVKPANKITPQDRASIEIALNDWTPQEGILILLDQFDSVITKPELHDAEILVKFFQKIRSSKTVSIICSSIRPVQQLRYQINQKAINQEALQTFSVLMKNFYDKTDRFDQIFTYNWKELQNAFPSYFQKIRKQRKWDFETFQRLVEDCFNGYELIQNSLTMHPYFLTVLNGFNGKSLESFTIFKFPVFRGELLTCLKIAFGLVEINIFQLEEKPCQRFKIEENGFIYQCSFSDNQNFKINYMEILTRSGAFKGPYFKDAEKVKPIPPNREARIALKLKSLIFYQIHRTGEFPPSMIVRFLSLQEEAQRRRDQSVPSFKTIEDILDVWWLFKTSSNWDYITEPFPQFNLGEIYILGEHRGINFVLLILSAKDCVIFLSKMKIEELKERMTNFKLGLESEEDSSLQINETELFTQLGYNSIQAYEQDRPSSGDFNKLLKIAKTQDTKGNSDLPTLHQNDVQMFGEGLQDDEISREEFLFAKFEFSKPLPCYARTQELENQVD